MDTYGKYTRYKNHPDGEYPDRHQDLGKRKTGIFQFIVHSYETIDFTRIPQTLFTKY